MNQKQKTILIIFALAFIGLTTLFCANDFVFADDTIRELEVDYPTIPEAEAPGEDPDGERTTLPEYIKYLFNFGIAIGGILAFLILVYGGFLWMTSSGDPTAIGKAKTKIFGGIIGLCLLLGAVLIIEKIDPDLKELKDIPDMLAKSGIYLCETDADCAINDSDKRKRYSGSIPKFPGDLTDTDAFHAKRACFISKKDELMAVYVHAEEGYKGTIIKEIKNTKDDDEDECCNKCCGDISGGKSLSFLWNRPGIYLYQEEDFVVEGTDKTPEYLRGGAKNLNEWDNITQSIKIVNPSEDKIIIGFLFNEPDYSGQCFHLYDALHRYNAGGIGAEGLTTEITNFSAKPSIAGTLSSIYTFIHDTNAKYSGEVNFFDQQNCKGNSFSVSFDPVNIIQAEFFERFNFKDKQGVETGNADKNVLSFEINGPFVVMILTCGKDGILTPNDIFKKAQQCQIFTKPNETNCYDSIITSDVYSETDNELRPRLYIMIPTN